MMTKNYINRIICFLLAAAGLALPPAVLAQSDHLRPVELADNRTNPALAGLEEALHSASGLEEMDQIIGEVTGTIHALLGGFDAVQHIKLSDDAEEHQEEIEYLEMFQEDGILDPKISKIVQWLADDRFIGLERVSRIWRSSDQSFLRAVIFFIIHPDPDFVRSVSNRLWDSPLSIDFLRVVFEVNPELLTSFLEDVFREEDPYRWRLGFNILLNGETLEMLRIPIPREGLDKLQAAYRQFQEGRLPGYSTSPSASKEIAQLATSFPRGVVRLVEALDRNLQSGSPRSVNRFWRDRLHPERWENEEKVREVLEWVATYRFPTGIRELNQKLLDFTDVGLVSGYPTIQEESAEELREEFSIEGTTFPAFVATLDVLLGAFQYPEFKERMSYLVNFPDDQGDAHPKTVLFMGIPSLSPSGEVRPGVRGWSSYANARFFADMPREMWKALTNSDSYNNYLEALRTRVAEYYQSVGWDIIPPRYATGLEELKIQAISTTSFTANGVYPAITTAGQLKEKLAGVQSIQVPSDVPATHVLIVTPDGLPKLSMASLFVVTLGQEHIRIEVLTTDGDQKQRVETAIRQLGLSDVYVHDVKMEFGGNVGEAIASIQWDLWTKGVQDGVDVQTLVVTASSGLEEIAKFLGVPEATSGLEQQKAIIYGSQSIWS